MNINYWHTRVILQVKSNPTRAFSILKMSIDMHQIRGQRMCDHEHRDRWTANSFLSEIYARWAFELYIIEIDFMFKRSVPCT